KLPRRSKRRGARATICAGGTSCQRSATRSWPTLPALTSRRSSMRSPPTATPYWPTRFSPMSWAVSKHLVAFNPASGIERNATAKRERVVDAQEVPILWTALADLGDVRAEALKALLLLGQRPAEVANMRQRDLRVGEHTFEQHRGNGRVLKV